jgi:hypothetical protein
MTVFKHPILTRLLNYFKCPKQNINFHTHEVKLSQTTGAGAGAWIR